MKCLSRPVCIDLHMGSFHLTHYMAGMWVQASAEKDAGNGHAQQEDGQATTEPQNQAESNVELNLAVALRIISEKGCAAYIVLCYKIMVRVTRDIPIADDWAVITY